MKLFIKRCIQLILFIFLSYLYFFIARKISFHFFSGTTLSFDNIVAICVIIIYIVIFIPISLIIIQKIDIK